MPIEDDLNTKNQRSRQRAKVTLTYPQHAFSPEDILDFIELPQFSRRWEQLGLDVERDLWALQTMIMVAPKSHPVVPGTGGLRKLRFAPERWNTGKSGAARVLYVHYEDFGIALLCLVHSKNETEEISNAVKYYLKRTINDIESELRRQKAIRID